jgi:hypothetical protein
MTVGRALETEWGPGGLFRVWPLGCSVVGAALAVEAAVVEKQEVVI